MSDFNGFGVTGNIFQTILKGESAYEIAVKHGYIGTEEEWIKGIEDAVSCETHTLEEWEAMPDYIPKKDTVIVISDYEKLDDRYIPGIKIADGLNNAINLPYVTEGLKHSLELHVADDQVHICSKERRRWDNNVSCKVEDNNLIFY